MKDPTGLLNRGSIELRWTFRFALVMLIVVLGMAYYQFTLVTLRIRSDALLLMHLQAREILEAAERSPWRSSSRDELIAYIDQHISSAESELELGIRLLDDGGQTLLSRGSFLKYEIPGRDSFPTTNKGELLRELDVGTTNHFIVMATPLDVGWVEVAIDDSRFAESLSEMRNRFLISLPIASLITAFLSWVLARGSLLPIVRMTELARRISASELDDQLPTTGSGDELDRLAETLNEMIARVRGGVESLRGFANNAAHQLRTPISRLSIRLEAARLAERDPAADQELIEAAQRDLERVSRAITGMLRLAESDAGLPPGRRHAIDLGPLLAGAVEFFEPSASEGEVELVANTDVEAKVSGDTDWLTEMISNLLDNALKATPAGGRVTLNLSRNEDEAWIEILDSGPGFWLAAGESESHFRLIPADDPSTSNRKQAEVRLGLGLPLAQKIAHAHNGSVAVEPRADGGSRALVSLPLI